MSEWETRSCGELGVAGILLIEDGNHGEYRPRPDEFVDDGCVFIRAADMTDGAIDFAGAGRISELARQRIRKGIGQRGDVLLSHKGTVGKVAVVPDTAPEFVCSPQTTFWRSLDPNRLDPRYLGFYMRSPQFCGQLDAVKAESDMAPYVNLTQQRRFTLELPPIEIQRAIAEVLGALDDKIAANRKLIETATQLVEALVYTCDSWVSIAEVVEYRKTSRSPDKMGADVVAHYSLPAFDDGQMPEIASTVEIKSAKFLIERPSVLISKLNPRFPRVWDVSEVPDLPAFASTEFLVLESRFCSTSVLAALLRHPIVSSQLELKVAGTSGSHQRVKPDDLLATEIPDPRHVSAGVSDSITSMGNLVSDLRIESQSLSTLRDTLLPRLMSGELRVRDAVREVESVV